MKTISIKHVTYFLPRRKKKTRRRVKMKFIVTRRSFPVSKIAGDNFNGHLLSAQEKFHPKTKTCLIQRPKKKKQRYAIRGLHTKSCSDYRWFLASQAITHEYNWVTSFPPDLCLIFIIHSWNQQPYSHTLWYYRRCFFVFDDGNWKFKFTSRSQFYFDISKSACHRATVSGNLFFPSFRLKANSQNS
jgi:hypothetical protein